MTRNWLSPVPQTPPQPLFPSPGPLRTPHVTAPHLCSSLGVRLASSSSAASSSLVYVGRSDWRPLRCLNRSGSVTRLSSRLAWNTLVGLSSAYSLLALMESFKLDLILEDGDPGGLGEPGGPWASPLQRNMLQGCRHVEALRTWYELV